ncbi:hypothetical protein RBH29_12650 [Herbivorax sp. ANBcel31]|uniref:hypothetical protein n=1 Tax=Herbivorax sp. ANBcel31 TaxID=3069754 RepID=UPI0027B2592C|nr:hypothetical protein [Herbivorax sp. ANBcel31]MDQ2087274.1 hypothetical protein [Herbivorax sp. ANBcel31]
MNKKSLKVGLFIFIVFLVLINVNEYRLINQYSSAGNISNTSMAFLIRSIQHRQKALNEILETKHITVENFTTIQFNYSNRVPEFERYGVELFGDEIMVEKAINSIHDFFYIFSDDKKHMIKKDRSDILVEIDDDLRYKIECLLELNGLWLSSIERNYANVIDKDDVSEYDPKPFREFLKDIENDTVEFLNKYQINDINELLY